MAKARCSVIEDFLLAQNNLDLAGSDLNIYGVLIKSDGIVRKDELLSCGNLV